MQIVQFPKSEDFGGFTPAYLAQLNSHFSYIKAATKDLLKLLKRTPSTTHKAEWVDAGSDVNVIHIEIDAMSKDTRRAVIDNLVGYAAHKGKRIVRVCHGKMDLGQGLRWYCFCELG
jgi:hypothetical protein